MATIQLSKNIVYDMVTLNYYHLDSDIMVIMKGLFSKERRTYRMNRRLNLLMILVIFLVCSCSVKTTGTWVKGDLEKFRIKNIAILQFENNNIEVFKKHYPAASDIVYNSFESSFLKLGFNVVERKKINTIINELKLSQTGLTVDEGARVGKLANADVLVLGTINSYVQGASTHEATGKLAVTQFGMSIKGVHVESGVILWSGKIFKNIDTPFGYTSPVENLVNEVVDMLINELMIKGLKST